MKYSAAVLLFFQTLVAVVVPLEQQMDCVFHRNYLQKHAIEINLTKHGRTIFIPYKDLLASIENSENNKQDELIDIILELFKLSNSNHMIDKFIQNLREPALRPAMMIQNNSNLIITYKISLQLESRPEYQKLLALSRSKYFL
jgi:hypothetical protein